MALKKKAPSLVRQNKEKGCAFCKAKKTPNWQDYDALREYLSPRGRILGRDMTGICVKHQRKLADSIKNARHLGLLPFTTLEEN